jgi:hypothetical protein
LPGGNGADRHSRRRGERLVAGAAAIGFEKESRQIKSHWLAQPAPIPRRHGGLNVLSESARATAAPGTHEVGAGQLRRFVASAEIRKMATGAVRLISRAARGGLPGGVWADGNARLRRGNRETARGHEDQAPSRVIRETEHNPLHSTTELRRVIKRPENIGNLFNFSYNLTGVKCEIIFYN